MAVRTIRVAVDPSAARAGLAIITNAAIRLQGGMNGLRLSIVAALASLGAGEYKRLADTYTLLQNRIKLVTSSQAEQVRISNELLDLANRTRTPLEDTIELYGRAARSLQDLGVSQQQIIDLTETVNKAIQISGSTSQEASNGVIQFSQSLASGRLNGEELRSVLEQMPRLARAIADGLDVNIGDLRRLGAAGELTVDKLLEAIRKTAPEIATEFEELNPTIEQSFSVLSNEMLNLVGQFDQSLGVSAAIGKNIQGLATVIRETTPDVVLFGLALKTSMSTRFAEVSRELDTIDEKFFLFRNTVAGTIATIFKTDSLKDITASRAQIEENLRIAEEEADKTFKEIERLIRERGTASVVEFLESLEDAAAIDLNKPGENKRRPSPAEDPKKNPEQEAAESLLETLQRQTLELDLQNQYGEAADQHIRAALIDEIARTSASQETVNALRAISTELTVQEMLAAELADQAVDADSIRTLEQQLALLLAEGDARFRILAIQELSANATEEQIQKTAELLKKIDAAEKAEQQQLITLEEINKLFVQGVGDAVGNFVKDFQGGFDSILESFSELLLDISAEIIKNIIVTQFFKSFSNQSGGFIGAIVGALGGTVSEAGQFGAPATPGRPIIVGEGNRPEVFIPSQPGRIEPMSSFGKGATVIVINEQDPRSLLATLETRDGVRVQRNFVNADRRSIKRTLGVR